MKEIIFGRLNVPLFNVVKYLVSSIVVGVFSEYLTKEIESTRRAISLRKHGRTRLMTFRSRLLRAYFGVRPLSGLLIFTITFIVVYSSELFLEIGTDSKDIPKEIKMDIMRPELKFDYSESSQKEVLTSLRSFESMFCSLQRKNIAIIFSSSIILDPLTNISTIICPLNVTNFEAPDINEIVYQSKVKYLEHFPFKTIDLLFLVSQTEKFQKEHGKGKKFHS